MLLIVVFVKIIFTYVSTVSRYALCINQCVLSVANAAYMVFPFKCADSIGVHLYTLSELSGINITFMIYEILMWSFICMQFMDDAVNLMNKSFIDR